MSQYTEIGSAWSQANDDTWHSKSAWEEAIRYNKPPSTPPWPASSSYPNGIVTNNHIASQASHNPFLVSQYGSSGPSTPLGVYTPAVSSSTSSQAHYENRSSRQCDFPDTTLSQARHDRSNEQLEPYSCTSELASEEPVQDCGNWDALWQISGPTASEDYNHFTSQFQNLQPDGTPEVASHYPFPTSIEHAEHQHHAVSPVSYVPNSTRGYELSLPQIHIHPSPPDVNHDANHATPMSNSLDQGTPFSHNTGSPGTQGSSPSKRARISASGSLKAKKVRRTRIIHSGPVIQFVYPTENHVRRAAYSPERKEKVNERRKVGACVCCSWSKKTCEPADDNTLAPGQEVCKRCLNKMVNNKTSGKVTHLCFVFTVDGIQMFRPHSPLHNRPVTATIDYVPGTAKTIEIRLTGNLQSPPIKLRCLEFRPHKDDVVIKMFGSTQQIPIRPYAIENINEYREALPWMLSELTEVFLQDLERTGCANTVSKTLRAAIKYRDDNPTSLVAKALRIWVLSKLCSTEKVMVGDQRLGVAPVQEEGVDLEGMTPVPPKVDHQTDTAMIDSMKHEAFVLVDNLKRLIDKKKREDWFHIFLTVFIVLNNLEFLLKRQERFLDSWQKHRDKLNSLVRPGPEYDDTKRCVKRCIEGSESLISEFRTSAHRILQIYQLYAGTRRAPFAAKRNTKDLKDAALLPHEIEYVESMQNDQERINDQHRGEHEIEDHNYELRWTSQLFQQLD